MSISVRPTKLSDFFTPKWRMIFCLIAASLVTIVGIRTAIVMTKYAETIGTIERIESHRTDGLTRHYPVLRYPESRRATVVSKSGKSRPVGRSGDKVTVLYRVDDPDVALVKSVSTVWGPLIIAIVVSALLLCVHYIASRLIGRV